MANETVAKRYARALLEVAREENALERFEQDLMRVVDLLEANETLREVLSNPVFDPEARRAILRDVATRLGVAPLVTNFLLLLLDKRKLPVLPEIVRTYHGLVDQEAGRVEATLASAVPVDGATASRVEQELARWTGKRVRLKTAVDPSLIGGVVARVDGLVLDASIRTQLDALRQRLAKD